MPTPPSMVQLSEPTLTPLLAAAGVAAARAAARARAPAEMIHFFMTESSLWVEGMKNVLVASPVPRNFVSINNTLLSYARNDPWEGRRNFFPEPIQTATPWRNCGREPERLDARSRTKSPAAAPARQRAISARRRSLAHLGRCAR